MWAWAVMYAVATKTCENRARHKNQIFISFFFSFFHYLSCPVLVPTATKNASYEGMQKQIPKLQADRSRKEVSPSVLLWKFTVAHPVLLKTADERSFPYSRYALLLVFFQGKFSFSL